MKKQKQNVRRINVEKKEKTRNKTNEIKKKRGFIRKQIKQEKDITQIEQKKQNTKNKRIQFDMSWFFITAVLENKTIINNLNVHETRNEVFMVVSLERLLMKSLAHINNQHL